MLHPDALPLAALALPDLSLGTWTGILAAGAFIGTCWRTIGEWLKRLADLVICRVAVKDEAARAVMSMVWIRGKRSPFGLRLFGGTASYVFPKQRVEVVGFEGVTSEPLLFWFGRVPILFAMGQKNSQQESVNLGHFHTNAMPVTLRFLRGTLDVDEFIEAAIKSYNDLRQTRAQLVKSAKGPRRFNVIRLQGNGGRIATLGREEPATPRKTDDSSELITQIQRNELRLLTWRQDDLIERATDAPAFSSHPVSPDILTQFGEIGAWLKREQWYRSKGVPWRRGYLLYGGTGSGKSTIVRNVAIQYDLPLYTFDLSSYDNRSFAEDWKTVQQNAPAIALLEDFDCCFKGRDNLHAKAGQQRDTLTFDCLLNTVSGVGSSDGVLLFVTTNHLESLDPALGVPTGGGTSTRPGRIDRAIHVGPMAERERRILATLMVGDWPLEVEPVVAAGEGEMAAQFQERCARLALRLIDERGLPEGIVMPEPPERGTAVVPQKRLVWQTAGEDFDAVLRARELNPHLHA